MYYMYLITVQLRNETKTRCIGIVNQYEFPEWDIRKNEARHASLFCGSNIQICN